MIKVHLGLVILPNIMNNNKNYILYDTNGIDDYDSIHFMVHNIKKK